jgi:hypothetical protein
MATRTFSFPDLGLVKLNIIKCDGDVLYISVEHAYRVTEHVINASLYHDQEAISEWLIDCVSSRPDPQDTGRAERQSPKQTRREAIATIIDIADHMPAGAVMKSITIYPDATMQIFYEGSITIPA